MFSIPESNDTHDTLTTFRDDLSHRKPLAIRSRLRSFLGQSPIDTSGSWQQAYRRHGTQGGCPILLVPCVPDIEPVAYRPLQQRV